MADLEAQARQLYEQGTRSAPAWSQLGPGTQAEWREMARRKAAGDPEWWSVYPPKQALAAAPVHPKEELF